MKRSPVFMWDCLKRIGQMTGSYLCAQTHKPLLLYGIAGFLWERERIPEKDVERCLGYYEDRMKSPVHTSHKSTVPPVSTTTAAVTTPWFSWFTIKAKEPLESERPETVPVIDKKEAARQKFISSACEYYTEKSKERLSELPVVGLITKERLSYKIGSIIARKTRENIINLIGGPAVVERIRENETELLQKAYKLIQTNIESLHTPGDPIADLAYLEVGFPPQNNLISEWWPVSMETTNHYAPVGIRPEINTSNTLEKGAHTFDSILGSDSILDSYLHDQANQLCHSLVHKTLKKVHGILKKRIPRNTEHTSINIANDVTRPEATPSQDTSIGYLNDWELFLKESTYMVFRKPYADTDLYQFKVIGAYDDVTAKDFYEVQFQEKSRMSWDHYVTKLKIIDSDANSDCQVVHWIMKFPFPLSKREYVYVHKKWISPKEDAIVFVNKSVDHPEAPESNGATRVKDYYSEMVIKAHTTIDKPGINYELTYFDDPQVTLPSSLVNWVATSATPDFLSKVYKAALKRRQTNPSAELTATT